MSKSFNIVIATTGRSTLERMINSIAHQLEKQDFLTIIWDGPQRDLTIHTKAQVANIVNDEPLGFWGHGSRNEWIPKLPGDYFLNADDDDEYLPGAMDKIRSVVTEDKLYVFKIQYGKAIIPSGKELKVGNIGTPCGVYPKVDPMPIWEHRYGGDGDFYVALSKMLPVKLVDHVIYKVGDKTPKREMPPKPDSIKCDCGYECHIHPNQMLLIWEGHCSRCDKTIR